MHALSLMTASARRPKKITKDRCDIVPGTLVAPLLGPRALTQ